LLLSLLLHQFVLLFQLHLMVLLELMKLLLLMKVLRGELCLEVFIESLMLGHCKCVCVSHRPHTSTYTACA
jgi:hypothetical protein